MKKILLGTVALIALGMSSSAFAADLGARVYTKAPPPPPAPIYNWTGFYIGAHIGAAFGNDNTIFGNNDARFLGGGQIGADYQFAPNWVAGIEGQYSAVAGNNNGLFRERGLASVTGRLGYTWGPALLYVKGGYAYQDRSNNALGVIGTGNRDGYTVGAGLEYMFAPSWSAKLEYQYYDFGRYNFVRALPAPAIAGNFNNDEHSIKLGVNYRFGWGGPVVAKY